MEKNINQIRTNNYQPMKQQLLSIIIPTFNEQRDIENCIKSLKQQTYQPLEIIIVDDGSKDKTLNILKKIQGIKVYKQGHFGPGSARNRGAMKAKGKMFIFVDADMTFDKRFIDKLTKPIREKKAIGTFSKEEYVSNTENRWSTNWSINRGWKQGRMHSAKYPDKQKVFRAILAHKFLEVGGFDEKMGYTDDWSLSKKLHTEAINAPGAIFYHRNPDSLKEAFAQSKWMAKRPYKLWILGRTLALIRVTFPFSLIVGTYKSIRHKKASFLIFKLITDFAAFIGIFSLYFRRSRAR